MDKTRAQVLHPGRYQAGPLLKTTPRLNNIDTSCPMTNPTPKKTLSWRYFNTTPLNLVKIRLPEAAQQ
jgi:hypothetical protein